MAKTKTGVITWFEEKQEDGGLLFGVKVCKNRKTYELSHILAHNQLHMKAELLRGMKTQADKLL